MRGQSPEAGGAEPMRHPASARHSRPGDGAPAAGRRRRRRARRCPPRGFTLVEVLVVLVIVGLAGAAVVLTAPGDERRLQHEAETLAARLLRAREEAVLGNRAVQVRVTGAGYDFARQDFDAWRPLREGPFRAVRFADGVRARMPAATRQAQVSFRFDPTGGSQAREVVLERLDRSVRVAIDDAGEVSVDALR